MENMISPKNMAPIGVKKLRIPLLPVAMVYTISIHLVLKVIVASAFDVDRHV
jgi:hypothetical protein